ncbi:DUF2271 domain-containing protein [Moritella sp. 5]|uniref:DUF2271 domain-containing protein n=1 Tax=Moritella sp. 5 TaxID=2746231 RepID=UPI001BA66B95|nr:DUF2271 domain-containing protein [Moritella sp. 5]QUM82281.1 DUF2271 domain-containing protein [Moritella sp. 5]
MTLLFKRLSQCVALLSCLLLPAYFASAAPIPATATLDVEFSLPKIDTTMYARPYVAIWIENSKRKSVRTVELWVGKDEWLKDLRSWWRKVGRYDRALVDGVTSATRPAGDYRFTWDGLDSDGNRVEAGNYTFYVEVVREHGGRNYIRQKMTLDDKPFSHTIDPTEETGDIRINYLIK